ncbi:MAG TPA: response regulator [Chthoniobacterales bacterium]|jgi:CheY-like chemotaxis protein
MTETKPEHLMLDHEDLKWLAANATELNRLLQKAARQAEQARLRQGEGVHFETFSDQLERASRSSQAIFDRITARIMTGTSSGGRVDETISSSTPAASVATRMPVGEIVMTEKSKRDPQILNPQGERELILLVDDDQEILDRTGEMLDFEDYRFITAKDGLEALQIYRQLGREIDLVLLDYFLPVMDGDAVFDELKAIEPRVRVVLTSGFGEQARVGSMLQRGLCGFIPKPYTHEKLVEQIHSVLQA